MLLQDELYNCTSKLIEKNLNYFQDLHPGFLSVITTFFSTYTAITKYNNQQIDDV